MGRSINISTKIHTDSNIHRDTESIQNNSLNHETNANTSTMSNMNIDIKNIKTPPTLILREILTLDIATKDDANIDAQLVKRITYMFKNYAY